jgi:hypothetical protein
MDASPKKIPAKVSTYVPSVPEFMSSKFTSKKNQAEASAIIVVQPNTDLMLYQTEDGQTRVEVGLDGETVWLNLMQMTELIQRDKSVISKHIKNVFDEGELSSGPTVAKFATVQKEGDREVSREIEYYNLDVIISVGYRVKSHRGT